MNLFGKIFKISFLLVLITEMASFCGYFLPLVNSLSFFIILLAVFFLAVFKLEYGFFILLAELFVGSKGYLFYFEIFDKTISIRVALWLAIMAVWFAKILIESLKKKKLELSFRNSSYFAYFIIFFLLIAFGIINGFMHKNNLSNLFFDFNGWLYLTLLFPSYDLIMKSKDKIIESIMEVFTASVAWLSIKSLLLVYIFAHFSGGTVLEIYRWVRTSGVGEITLIKGGFYRVFFQSHIFLIAAFFFFVILMVFLNGRLSIKKQLPEYLLLLLVASVNVINFSRSNWLGLAFGIVILFIFILFLKDWEKIKNALYLISTSFLLSALIIIAIVKFPFPKAIGGFSASDLFADRASNLTEEAGVSSRWSLLPELWKEIRTAPIFGKGYGATVTYKSSDPRVLEKNPGGLYTTYAFEWGWLDVWLKFGFVGLLFYSVFILKVYIFDNYKYFFKRNKTGVYSLNDIIVISFSLSMIVIASVSFFSPYLNHPLGLGYMVISVPILENLRRRN